MILFVCHGTKRVLRGHQLVLSIAEGSTITIGLKHLVIFFVKLFLFVDENDNLLQSLESWGPKLN